MNFNKINFPRTVSIAKKRTRNFRRAKISTFTSYSIQHVVVHKLPVIGSLHLTDSKKIYTSVGVHLIFHTSRNELFHNQNVRRGNYFVVPVRALQPHVYNFKHKTLC